MLGTHGIIAVLLAATAALAQDADVSLSAFARLHAVATSPRCVNCHQVDHPLNGDAGVPHRMFISRNIIPLGMRCTTCHSASGDPTFPLPPTAPGWNMPSPAKALSRQMSPAELCAAWKDPGKNFRESGDRKGEGRTLREMLEHISTDALVRQSWHSGGRTPPPGSHDDFVKDFAAWIDNGAACPQ